MNDVSVRYAVALKTVALKINEVNLVAEEIGQLAIILQPFIKTFSSPVFSVKKQTQIITSVLKDKCHPLSLRFVNLLVANRRLGDIKQISDTFKFLLEKETGLINLHFKVFYEPEPETIEKLIKATEKIGMYKQTEPKNIKTHFEVDKTIMGGFIAECDGFSWNCSLSTRLLNVTKYIKGGNI